MKTYTEEEFINLLNKYCECYITKYETIKRTRREYYLNDLESVAIHYRNDKRIIEYEYFLTSKSETYNNFEGWQYKNYYQMLEENPFLERAIKHIKEKEELLKELKPTKTITTIKRGKRL